jgi:4-hydroxybenzoate polyprenyltransferase
LTLAILHFSHDQSNWSFPFFSSTTFQNFPGVSYVCIYIYMCVCVCVYIYIYNKTIDVYCGVFMKYSLKSMVLYVVSALYPNISFCLWFLTAFVSVWCAASLL